MPDTGPPRSNFGIFGGPGFIFALLALLGIGLGTLYLAKHNLLRRPGGASMSLPGSLGDPTAAKQEQAGGEADALQSMQPMTAAGADAPAQAQARPEYPTITEDLSPIDLLVRYTPEPYLALGDDAGSENDARWFRRPSRAPAGARRLALVVTGLGLDRALTAQMIVAMPADVSLSFDPGSADLADWINAARAYGHEALIDLELGTAAGLSGAPADSADDRLLAELGPQENLRRLEALLERAPKAAGVAVQTTDAFLGDAAALTPILTRLQQGGLAIIGLPVTAPLTIAADRILPQALNAAAIGREAMALKALARQRGAVLVVTTAENAIALDDALADAVAGAGKTAAELSLVPASALVED